MGEDVEQMSSKSQRTVEIHAVKDDDWQGIGDHEENVDDNDHLGHVLSGFAAAALGCFDGFRRSSGAVGISELAFITFFKEKITLLHLGNKVKTA